MLIHPRGLVTAAVRVVDLVVERAVGALGDTVLLDHVSVEGLAFAVPFAVTSVFLVILVLSLGIGAADVDIEGPGEEFAAHAVFRVIDGALGALGWRTTSWRSGGKGVVRLLVAVGARDDDVEVPTIATKVVSGSSLNARAPKGALEIGNRGWLRAVGAGVQAGVTFDVEIEGCAKGSVIAPGGAVLGAVGGEGM